MADLTPLLRRDSGRLRVLRDRPADLAGAFVLYWMTSARRASWSFALDRAVGWATELGRPLVVLEALRAGYPWASDRHHVFVLEGMADTATAFDRPGVLYYPYVERARDDGKGLLAALAASAAVVVADDSPAFFLPRMLAAAAARVSRRLEAVDGCGLLPLERAGRAFPTAYVFRRHLQKVLGEELSCLPKARPFEGFPVAERPVLPRDVLRRWPPLGRAGLEAPRTFVRSLPIDHEVSAVPLRGGARSAGLLLDRFLEERLDRYAEERNHPDAEASSELSAHLHFGHVSPHEIVVRVLDRSGWSPLALSGRATGKRAGWWGAPPGAEAFLDQVVTWRELGYTTSRFLPDADGWASLPAWARATLAAHEDDDRPTVYSPSELEEAKTHDPLWNAAQRQLRESGVIHNYLRMLWGKKILEWTPSPREALRTMLALNDRWAVDGRDPNSISGITWCLGRYDRPWAPVRPVFGSIRYMSSASTLRKLRLKRWLERWNGNPERP